MVTTADFSVVTAVAASFDVGLHGPRERLSLPLCFLQGCMREEKHGEKDNKLHQQMGSLETSGQVPEKVSCHSGVLPFCKT